MKKKIENSIRESLKNKFKYFNFEINAKDEGKAIEIIEELGHEFKFTADYGKTVCITAKIVETA